MLDEIDASVMEDLQFLDEMWGDDYISNTKIKHISVCLRRLLIENAIFTCNRKFKIKLEASSPDIKWIRDNIPRCNVDYYQCAGAVCFGVYMSNIVQERYPNKLFGFMPEGWNPEKSVILPLNNFLSQEVIYFYGQTINRRDVLSYVCNKAGAVHIDEKRENPIFGVLDQIRNGILLSSENGMPSITINLDQEANISGDFVFRRNHVDPVFLETYAVCKALLESSSISLLRQKLDSLAS